MVQALQGVVTGSLEGGASASLQDDFVWRDMLHTEKMASMVQESDSAQGSQQLTQQLFPRTTNPSLSLHN